MGGKLAAQWAIEVPVLCSQWGLLQSDVELPVRVGLILDHNGLLLIAAPKGKSLLLSARGRLLMGVKLVHTHLHLREAPQGEWNKMEDHSFHSHTGSLLSRSIKRVVLNKKPRVLSQRSFIILQIIKQLWGEKNTSAGYSFHLVPFVK